MISSFANGDCGYAYCLGKILALLVCRIQRSSSSVIIIML